MYVILEYLTCLAFVTIVGIALFGATVLALIFKAVAAKLAGQVTPKLSKLISQLKPPTAAWKKAESSKLLHSHQI
jgi:hypothetical protein